MRKWIIGLLALAGSALAVVPGAMAQSEFGRQTWRGWFGNEDQYTFYTAPTDPNYDYIPPRSVYLYPAVPPGVSYFGPPVEMQVGPGPGNCGEFRYWSDRLGRCVDARRR